MRTGRSASPRSPHEENSLIAYRRILENNNRRLVTLVKPASPQRNASPKLRRGSLEDSTSAQPNKETDEDDYSTPTKQRRTKSMFVSPNTNVEMTPNDQGIVVRLRD
jgi:hypothetical protein